MRFELKKEKNKYEPYSIVNGVPVIAKCVMMGVALTVVFEQADMKPYAVPELQHNIEWMQSKQILDNDNIVLSVHGAQPVLDLFRIPYFDVLESLSHLKDNWDGDGAVQPNQEALTNSKRLLSLMDITVLQTLSPESVYASSYGSVVMDFETNRGLVSVEMGDKSMGFYTDFHDKKNYAVEGISTDFQKVPETLESYLS